MSKLKNGLPIIAVCLYLCPSLSFPCIMRRCVGFDFVTASFDFEIKIEVVVVKIQNRNLLCRTSTLRTETQYLRRTCHSRTCWLCPRQSTFCFWRAQGRGVSMYPSHLLLPSLPLSLLPLVLPLPLSPLSLS